MVDWLRQALALPDGYTGVIQDSASSATLSAVLTMRERAIGFSGNREGLHGKGRLRIYCSDHVHSSIDRAARVAGIGQEIWSSCRPEPRATGSTWKRSELPSVRAGRRAMCRLA